MVFELFRKTINISNDRGQKFRSLSRPEFRGPELLVFLRFWQLSSARFLIDGLFFFTFSELYVFLGCRSIYFAWFSKKQY